MKNTPPHCNTIMPKHDTILPNRTFPMKFVPLLRSWGMDDAPRPQAPFQVAWGTRWTTHPYP